MPKIVLSNETKKILGICVEPWGEDYWMRPTEQLTIATETPEGMDSDDAPFDVVFHDQGVSVGVNIGYEEIVYDQSGSKVECGHQRPIEVLRMWTQADKTAPQ
ncbi:hypothetical protein [Streptomyces sp. NPDC054865]